MSNIINNASLELGIQLSGLLNGKIAKIYNVIGRRGGFPNTTNFFGIGEGIGASAAAVWPTLTGVETIQAVSSSAQDIDITGTGVRAIKATYINATWDLVTTGRIALNGTTPVTIATDMRSLLFVESVDSGSTLAAVGTITIQNQSGPTTISQITALNSRSFDAKFTVPIGYNGYILNYFITGKQNSQDARILTNGSLYDGSLQTNFRTLLSCYTPGENNSPFIDSPMLKVPPMGTVYAVSDSSSTSINTRCDVNFRILIVQN